MNDAATNPEVTPALPKGGPRKAAVLFIFATALMDVISLGIMIPVLPNLIKQFAGGDTAFGIGFLVGPAIGGALGDINLRLPFWAAAGLALCNWLYGFFVLPESLPPSKRTTSLNWRRANPVGALRFLRERQNLLGLISINVLYLFAHNVFPSIFVLYVGYRFNWGPFAAAAMLIATGLSSILVQTLVVGRVVKAIGERGALLIGLVSASLAFIAYALASTPRWFFAGVPLGALSALIMPGLQSLMSRRVAANEQGRLQGLNSAFMGLTAILGPLLYLSLLAFAVRHDVQLHQPGIPILVAAVFCLSAFGLAV